MSVADRLTKLGIILPAVAMPLAAYRPWVVSGSLVFTAGQLPTVDGELAAVGKVGTGPGSVPPERATELSRIAMINALAAVQDAIGSLDRVTQVVKVVGFVASEPTFTGQPAVIDGASKLLGEVFGECGGHARSAVGVSVLPKNSPVEVEIVVEFRRD